MWHASLVLLLAWAPGGPPLRPAQHSGRVMTPCMQGETDSTQLLLAAAAEAAKASLEKGKSTKEAKAAGAAAWAAAQRATDDGLPPDAASAAGVAAGEATDEGQPEDAVAAAAEAAAKQKSKTDRFLVQFTCSSTLESGETCGTPNVHSISKHAYRKGTVIVRCPGCNSSHLIADNLDWIGDVGLDESFKNLEEYMERQGESRPNRAFLAAPFSPPFIARLPYFPCAWIVRAGVRTPAQQPPLVPSVSPPSLSSDLFQALRSSASPALTSVSNWSRVVLATTNPRRSRHRSWSDQRPCLGLTRGWQSGSGMLCARARRTTSDGDGMRTTGS